MPRLVLATLSIFVIALGVVVAARGDTIHGEAFTFTFDGAPPAPLRFSDMDWDVQAHVRSGQIMTQAAHHGPDCSAPPATHTINDRLDSVFLCRDHVMTAIGDGGYALVYLTPNRLVDFSAGEAVIRFDMSTFRASDRDWVDIWVTPYAENQARPLDDWLPSLQGEPRRAIQIRMDKSTDGGTMFRATVFRNHSGQDTATTGASYTQWLVPDAARRDTFELRISRTHIQFGMPAFNQWWIDSTIADLGWDQGVVQLGHHSYDPYKGSCMQACGPNTWHWDNVSIDPAVPFGMIAADKRQATSSNPIVTFASPAPEGAHLRFAALCRVEVSLNGGPYQLAQRQIEEMHRAEHHSSYWHPVPAGTQQVAFRFSADDWYSGPCNAQDFSIFSPNGVTPSTPTSTPSTSPNTPTSVPSTATPTFTPIPSGSTPTPTPVVQPTPAPQQCRVQLRNASNSGWTNTGGYVGTMVGGECRR